MEIVFYLLTLLFKPAQKQYLKLHFKTWIETSAPEAEDGEDEEGGGDGQGEEHGQPPGGGGRGRVILVSPLRRVRHCQRRRAAAHRGIERTIDNIINKMFAI